MHPVSRALAALFLIATSAVPAAAAARYSARQEGDVITLEDATSKTSVSIGPTIGNIAFDMSINGQKVLRWPYATLDDFSSFLQMIVFDRPVVNHTSLKGRFDFHVIFTPDDSQFHGHPPNFARPPAGGAAATDPATPAAESAPNLFEAIQQQVGLRLSPEKTEVDVVVIDHIEKPSAN